MTSKKLLGKSFILLWLSETAFDIGSALMGFALGVWVFEKSGSVQQFSWAILSSAVPALLSIPFAGMMADRFDRRWVIASCDFLAVLMVVIVALLVFNQMLEVEHLYIVGAVGGVIGAIRNPSYHAAVAQIVPHDRLTQANGLISGTQGVLQIGAPLVAGFLLASWGMVGIMIIELFLSVAGALAVFAALTSARHAIRGVQNDKPVRLFEGIHESFASVAQYFRQHSLMIGLAVYILIQEALLVLASTMLTPLILTGHGSETLGIVMTLGAVGGVIGAFTLAATNPKAGLMRWVLIADVALAFFVMLAGIVREPALWCICAFGAFAFGGVSEGCSNALWMRKVPKDRQGSVFAAVGAANLVIMCIVMLTGSTLVEQFFEPLMMPGGALADSVGEWLGVGKGRGVALLFVLAGAIFAVVSMVALLHPRLTRLDELVPDQAKPDGDQNADEASDIPESASPALVPAQASSRP
ncbi:MFS transporter [Thauera sinica]|uniref:MFS transporter n=1 Tax=Thauera sinica TaxID=2665146 RepID=A0ABW1AM50_9RHOO|nr:MFS transporter [Thauera sp. K11]